MPAIILLVLALLTANAGAEASTLREHRASIQWFRDPPHPRPPLLASTTLHCYALEITYSGKSKGWTTVLVLPPVKSRLEQNALGSPFKSSRVITWVEWECE